MTESVDERNRISNNIKDSEGGEMCVIRIFPTCRAAITAQVRSHHVIARCGERQHYFPPAISQLRKTMQQENRRPARHLETRFEHVHRKSVDVGHRARPDALRDSA